MENHNIRYMNYLLSAFLLFTFTQSFAQNFSHRTGLAWMSSWEKPYELTIIYDDRPAVDVVTPKDRLGFIGAFYHLSYAIKNWESKAMSISVDAPIALSLFLSVSANQGASPKNYVLLDLPLQLSWNIGAGALAESEATIGGYFTVGMALHLIDTKSVRYFNQQLKYNQLDPQLGGGLRFRIGKRLFQLGYSHIFPIKQRGKLDEVYTHSGIVDILDTGTNTIPQEIIRGMDVVSLAMYLHKNY